MEVPEYRRAVERLFPQVTNLRFLGRAVLWSQIDWSNETERTSARLGLLTYLETLLTAPRNQHPYSLLESEAYLQQAFLWHNIHSNESATHSLSLARSAIYGTLVPRINAEGQFEEFDERAARQYLPGIVRNSGQSVINQHLAYASVQMGRILMMEATQLKEQLDTTSDKTAAAELEEQRQERLRQAQLYLCQAAGTLQGIDQLEIREMLGRSLLESGQTEEAAAHIDAVLALDNSYREQLVANNGVEPKRFTQIYTSALISRARINMIEAENVFQTAEETTETPSLQRRLEILVRAEEGLTAAIDSQYVYQVAGQEIRVPILTGPYLQSVESDREANVSRQAIIRGWLEALNETADSN